MKKLFAFLLLVVFIFDFSVFGFADETGKEIVAEKEFESETLGASEEELFAIQTIENTAETNLVVDEYDIYSDEILEDGESTQSGTKQTEDFNKALNSETWIKKATLKTG